MSLREKKAKKKKEDMINSAVSIIHEKGYHATTMEDIASKLLMTKGSVYYYFKDKQDLLYQSQRLLLSQSLKNIKEIYNEDLFNIEKLKKAMETHIKYLITERTGFGMGARPEQIFEGDQLIEIMHLRNTYSAYMDQLIIEGIKEGYFNVEHVKIVRNIILGSMNHVIEWYSPEGEKDETELAELISNYLLRILSNNSS